MHRNAGSSKEKRLRYLLSKKYLWIGMFFCFGICIPCEASKISKEIRKGKNLYANEDYVGALERFENALAEDENSDIVNFDVGAAKYKNEEYDDASLFFQKALLSENDEVKQKAYYNLGNSLYKLGLENEDLETEAAIKALEASVQGFEKSIELNMEDEDAKNNHAFVLKEIERVKKKLMQKESKQCPFPKDKKEGDEGDQKKDQQKSQQQQDQDDKDKEQQQQQQEQQQQQQGQDDSEEEKEDQSQSQPQSQEEQEQEQSSGGQEDEGVEEGEKSASGNDQMSEDQARTMIRSYQQSEEPQGILNLSTHSISPRNVEKDW